MEPADIIGHKVEAHGSLSVDRALWPDVQSRLLNALDTLAGEASADLLAAVEQFGWEIQRNAHRPTLLLDQTAGSGRWQAGHVLFLAELAAMGFEGTVKVESADDEIAVGYDLRGGTAAGIILQPEASEGHGAVADAAP